MIQLRDATVGDAAAIAALTNALLATTTNEWADEPRSPESMIERLVLHDPNEHPTLVAIDDGVVVGWAGYGDFRDTVRWPGYRPSVEHTIHVARDQWGQGVGRRLIEALAERARADGRHVMVAAIDGENLASVDFHRRVGFVEVGRLPEMGTKFGRRLDLILMQRFVNGSSSGSPHDHLAAVPPLDDATLAALGHLNYHEFSRVFTRQGGRTAVLVEEGGLLLHASSSAFPVLFNGVWRLDPRVPGTEVIARADEFFAARGRGYSVTVRDGVAVDADLVAAAEASGLLAVLHAPEMVCRDRLEDRPLPDRTDLRWVDDHRTFTDFVTVSDQAYSSIGLPVGAVVEATVEVDQLVAPHIGTVVAYVDDTAVAAAQVILSHSIAGVYWVGTTEGARGLGLGEAVTRAVTNWAFDAGARAVTLQASPMGAPIYRRMGYEAIYDYSTLVRFEPVG